MNPTLKTYLLLSVFLLAGLAQTATAGMYGREGMYIGVDLGVAEQDDILLNGSDNDVPTRCDQVLRDRVDQNDQTIVGTYSQGQGGQFSDITLASLTNRDPQDGCRRGDTWDGRDISMGTGVIAGAQVGWMFGHFRAEVEYLYRSHSDGERKNLSGVTGDKDAELLFAEQGLDSLSSHSVFANLYYDFMSDSRFTPYVGGGIGFSKVDFTYDALFSRNEQSKLNLDPNGPGGMKDPTMSYLTPDVAAHTTTDTNDELSDEVFGWQLMVGSDYAIDENWSIGLKLRYQRFDSVEDSDRWDQLRSHDPVIAEGTRLTGIRNSDPSLANFDPTVIYNIETDDDLEVWAASLNLKYRF